MAQLRLENIALRGLVGKEGVLKPDENGYYIVPLGAYGTLNSGGWHYDLNSVLPFFEKGSSLRRRIEKGVLYGEIDHPSPKDYYLPNGSINMPAYINRARSVSPKEWAFHIAEVWLEHNQRTRDGKTVSVVYGRIRPQGPYANIVREALDNPESNAHFSVRSITKDDNHQRIKYTSEIVTWDFVQEGGIACANKYESPSLESFDEVPFTSDVVWSLQREEKRLASLGMESAGLSLEDFAKAVDIDLTLQDNSDPLSRW